jgi:hypothetical protein
MNRSIISSSFRRQLAAITKPHHAFPMTIPVPQTPPTMQLDLDAASVPSVMARPQRSRRHALPASLMRCGTSKALFLHQSHLPASRESWTPVILAAMGSRNSDPRQIDGVGGATSTTSKVAVVQPSSRPGIDVDYTFAQVAVGQEKIDFNRNYRNVANGIEPWALEEGLIRAAEGVEQVYKEFRILI